MNSNKFEGWMHLLDDAKDRADDAKGNHKAFVRAAQRLNDYINGLLNPNTRYDLLELIQDYTSQTQEIVYLIGVEDGAKLQRNPGFTLEEDILKSVLLRVDAVKGLHKFYLKAEKALNDYMNKEFVSAAGTVMPLVSELIREHTKQMQEISYLIGVNDGAELQAKLDSCTLASEAFQQLYKQFE